jgi:uncharacterized membrane protein
MALYSWIKLLHILSATLLFGTGLGTAFFMFRAHLSGNAEAMRVTTRNVVLADWLFTTPAVIVQLGTGLWLTWQLGIPFGSAWFVAVVSLFVLVGICWLPVVWIQIRMRQIIDAGGGPEDYKSLMRAWVALGVPAFMSVLVLFYLMVSKAGATYQLIG